MGLLAGWGLNEEPGAVQGSVLRRASACTRGHSPVVRRPVARRVPTCPVVHVHVSLSAAAAARDRLARRKWKAAAVIRMFEKRTGEDQFKRMLGALVRAYGRSQSLTLPPTPLSTQHPRLRQQNLAFLRSGHLEPCCCRGWGRTMTHDAGVQGPADGFFRQVPQRQHRALPQGAPLAAPAPPLHCRVRTRAPVVTLQPPEASRGPGRPCRAISAAGLLAVLFRRSSL